MRADLLAPLRGTAWSVPLGLVLVYMLALSACAQPADDIIRFGLAGTPANLDPRYATDATSARINRLLYQRLVDFDEQVRPVPSLATWERLAPRHYRFYLQRPRPDFHDGSPVTAHDVAATYRSILEPGSTSPHAGTLQLIQRIEVLDADTLDFYLERPDPVFPGFAVIGILPAAGIEARHPFHEAPLGSGPFRIAGWPEPGRLRLVRNSDDQVFEFQHIGDPTVRVLKLLRGEIDLLQNDLPAELLDYLRKRPGITVQSGTGSNFAYLGFNLQDPAMGKLAVRRAIAHAIDRAAIIEHVLGGAARTAAAMLPPEHWAGNPALAPVEYDPGKSRQFLHAAGFDQDNPLMLDYKTSTDPVRVRIATILQQQLAEVGIRITLQSYDWGTFFGDIKAGRFQMYSLMWVGIKTPDIFRYAFHSGSLPPGGANRGRFTDGLTDRLLAEAEQGETLDSQAASWHALQARLLEQLPYVPLWYEDHVVAVRDGVSGYRLSPDGNYDRLIDVHKNNL
ncbi:MAG: ABC transporter substrate-binding protein [Gammaproteobacteria bacterium]